MAIDLKKMREKLDALKNKGKTWKPKIDSETKVRILPLPDGDPFIEKHFHYNVGKQTILCPKRNFDEDCPVCEMASQLWNEGNEEEKNMAKKLFVRQRFFSALILRDDKDPSVKTWGYSASVYEDLLSTCLNPEYQDITDPETGTDFIIKYFKDDSNFPKTKLVYSRNSSSLCDTKNGGIGKKKCAELLDSLPDFDTLYERRSSAQVQEILDAWIESEDSDSSESESEDREKFAAKSDKVTDVETAIEGLKD